MRNRFDACVMFCLGVMPLVSTLVTVGCGGPPPITPRGSASLDELKATLVDSLATGDYGQIWACVYPEGDEFTKDKDYRKSMEAMYAWGRNLNLSLRCVRVLDPNEFSIPPEAMYIDGRAIEPNFKPSHLLSIHYWHPPSEREPNGQGAATFYLDVSVGQVDGKWWCVGMKQADPNKPASQSVAESAKPLAPLGEELSKSEGVTLKRAESPYAELGFNSLFVKSEDAKEMTKSPRGAHLLGDLLLDVMPFDHWTKDFHLLPDGYYALSVENLPKTREECFDIVRETLEGAFDLKIEAGESSWDAFRITVPDKLPQDVWADADAEWSVNGGPSASTGATDSYQLKGVTFAEFEEWLSDHLNGPVTIVNPPEGKYSMDVLIGGVDEAKLLEVWLKEGGFAVEHYQMPVPTVTVSPADTSTKAE